ncbi:MAG: transglycosylase SLT domain-containing protein [Gemmatimonadetes bacterium]|nr:transglycosylase SLT domain-containing protein [Gemmatimonadota bacterium]MYE95636.1 transglycosylase SLT domain-containing protein [Gemmatimonadota bacterium]MYJ09465.1 transglycosylase SLT domain-containing protein [Gemmatimonadota bacterium]
MRHSRPFEAGIAARAARCLFLAAAFSAACAANPLSGQDQPRAAVGASIPDSIHRDLADGRHWKASRALRSHLGSVESASWADRLVLAEAEAGWKNWDGAIAALTPGVDDAEAVPPRVWLVLGSARQAAGDAGGAVSALTRFVETAAADARETLVVHSRLARSAAAGGVPDLAAEHVGAIGDRAPPLADWTALAAARVLSDAGEAGAVEDLLGLVGDLAVRGLGWALEMDAWAAAGDTARALESLLAIASGGGEAAATARTGLLEREWRFRLALGDPDGSVAAMEDLLRHTTRGSVATEASMAHWRVAGGSGPEILRLVAAAMGSGGEFGFAVRAWRLVTTRGGTLTDRDRLALARAYNGSGDRARAVEVYRELSGAEDPGIAAAALQAWAAIRSRQGRYGDARTLQDRLVERYPDSQAALDVVFFRGDDHQDAGRLDQAVDHYQQVVSMSPSADRAGLARMRWGQIHLARNETEAARRVFLGYVEDFPGGRRWEEASYWAAHLAEKTGDSAAAEALRARIREESPVSYYAFLADGAADSVFRPILADTGAPAEVADVPAGEAAVTADPEWLASELEMLALLDEAGLEDAVASRIASMRAMAGDSSKSLLSLAVALHDAGHVLEGIRVGLQLRGEGRSWDRTLLQVVYPFPHRELVESRARDLGLDPYLVAGIIRQESAFVPDIVSPAGAIGLMQVMPATGRQLAGRIGPRGFRTETLETPELNVHLGARFLADLMRRYEGDIPLVLSAYNAGPSRANRWRRFPEAEDPHRFTERIPFAETRGYVKNVVRNRALYRWLYREAGAPGPAS